MARTLNLQGRRAGDLAVPFLLLATFASQHAVAAPVDAQLVRDLSTESAPSSSRPQPLGQVSPGVVLLTAHKPTTGRELYRFDAAAGALALLKDINPGSGSSSIEEVTFVGGVAFFRAFDPSSGWELWRSDGTAAGTRLVRDLWPGAAGSYPSALMQLNGVLYFGACSAQGSCSLWRSDGTASGTAEVKPGLRVATSDALAGAQLGGRLYFSADGSDGAGFELWTTDGTSGGTMLVADLLPGGIDSFPYSSRPDNLVVAGGTLFFRAYSAAGRELWRSDGTSAGTAMVKDLGTGTTPWGDPNSGNPYSLAAVGGRLVFQASSDNWWERWYWVSDGTEAGTVRLRDSVGPIQPCAEAVFNDLAPATTGSVMYMPAQEGATGCELWRTDGTDAGTLLVSDALPGAGGVYPQGLTIVGSRVFFTASDGVSGRELWKSDGTQAGTVLVKDISPAPDPWGGYGPASLAAAGPLLLFAADDGAHGYELWRSDGTAAGTVLANDIWKSTVGSGPRDVVLMGGTVYFAANGDEGWALWRSDGTPAGTTSLLTSPSINCWRGIGDLTVANGRLFFLLCNSGRVSLWASDGTAAGTAQVASFESAEAPVEFEGSIYFAGYESESSFGLWRSDGTAAGTVRISDKYPWHLTAVGENLYFTADDAIVGWELWKTDGTAAGTMMVKDIYPGDGWGYPNSSYPRQLAALDERHLMFFAWTSDSGVELWRSDGTAAGTQLVKDIWPGEFGGCLMPEDSDDLYGQGSPIFTKFQGRLWFLGCDPDAGCEPWSTDGTAAGTTRLKDVLPGPSGSASSYFLWGMYPRYSGPRFGVLDGRLYFGAFSGGTGFELWSSDGTEGGTRLVKDLLPGDGSVASLFDSFTSAGEALYLIGCASNGYDSFKDCNLWKTDGTAAGTELALATPLNFDGGSYYFNGKNRMTVAGDSLYVPATDDEHGGELFRIPFAADPVRLLGALHRKVADVPPGTSLSSKVAQLQALVEKGNWRAACGAGGAFSNEVAAQRGKKLDPVLADDLVTEARAVMRAIGCK